MATEAQISTIKSNIATMASKGASEAEIDAYLKIEGVTAEQLRKSSAQPRSMPVEAAQQAGSGILSGIAQGTVGLPGSLVMGAEYAGRKTGKLINLGLEKIGAVQPGTAEKTEQEYLAGMEKMYPGFMAGTSTLLGLPTGYGVQQAVDPFLPEPSTATGKSIRRGAEIIGSAAVPVAGSVGLASRTGQSMLGAGARSATAYGVAPAVASEAAGGAVGFLGGGQKAQEYARAGGALLGGGVGAYMASGTKAQKMVSAPMASATPRDIKLANDLVAQGQKVGVQITPAEALYQVTNGRVDLTDIQRIVERVEPGAEVFRPFMASRAGQTEQAAERIKRLVTTTPGAPSDIGPRAATAAERAISDVRKGINIETEPLYLSAAQGTIPKTGFRNLVKNELFSSLLNQVRKDPAFAEDIKKLPSTNVLVLDAVRKKAEDLASRAVEAKENNLASKYGRVKSVIDSEIDAAIASAQGRSIRTNTPLPRSAQGLVDYKEALARQSQLRSEVLAPLERSPLGSVARSERARSGEEATSLAGKAVFPKTTAEGQEVGIGAALNSLRKNDPEVAAQLVRSGIDQRQQKYIANLVSGPNQFGGAAFAQSLAGSPQKMKNLATAIEAVTDGATADEAMQIIEVLKATGARKRPGSDTAFNQEFFQAMKSTEGWKALADTLTRPIAAVGRIGVAAEDLQFRRNAQKLAEILTSPDGVNLIASYGKEGRAILGRALRNYLLSQAASTPTTRVERRLIVPLGNTVMPPGLLEGQQ